MNIKYSLIAASYILLAVGASVIGYNMGASTVKDGTVTSEELKPESHEVLKYVDRTNAQEVNSALNAPIYITRDYSGLYNGYVTANISATDGYKSSRAQDCIKIDITKKNRILIGYGIYLADRIIYTAPDIIYMRSTGKLLYGAGLVVNVWSAHQLLGSKIYFGIEF